ncbi:MAG: GtrA family protein [Sedimentitalea sp.]
MSEAISGSQRFGRYAIIGVASNLSLYLLFLALVWVGIGAVVASGICYVLGVAISYIGNRFWTFNSQKGHSHDLPRFLAAYGVGLLVTLVCMTLLVGPLGPAVAQLVTIVICALSIFSMLRLLRFGG